MRNIGVFTLGVLLFISGAYPIMAAAPGQEVTITTTTVPTKITVGLGIYDGTNVLINEIITIDFEEYIAGVIQAEVEEFTRADHVEARKAQGVVARSYAVRNINTREDAHIDAATRKKVDVDICGTEHHQAFSKSPKDIFKTAANDTAGQVIKYGDSVIDATFFSSSRTHYTKNAEDFWPNYSVYRRKTITPETEGRGGHGVGMSQFGARDLSADRVGYQDIIYHYYGPVPPYVKRVKVTQEGKDKYDAYWEDDNNYPNPTRTLKIQTNIPLKLDSDAIIEIHFSEQVLPGSNASEIKVKVGNEEASYVSGSLQEGSHPPAKLEKKLTAAQLEKIGTGIHPIKIKARHKLAQDWQLDKNPKTFAYQNHNADNLVGYEAGEDESHRIAISISLIVNLTSVDSSDFPKIKLYTTVEDVSGKPVLDLGTSHFKVNEDQTWQSPISVISVGAGFVGMSVCIIMDTSGSMSGSPITAAKQAAISFVNNLKPEDKAALIRFRETVYIVQPFTDDRGALISAIKGLYADGGTAFYDALYKGIAMASTQPGIKAIVALTDGKDNSSVKTAKEVIDYAKSVKLPVYIVGLVGGEGIDEPMLQLIATETEGQYYRAPTPAELQKLYQSISERLKNLYEVSYTTHNKDRDGTIRLVTVWVIHNEASGQDSVLYTAPGLAGAISGVVLDSRTGVPIKSASILIEHETGKLKITDASVNTNEKGEYRVENLSPDFSYTVTVSALNYHQIVYPKLVKVKAFEITEKIDFKLQPMEDYFVAKRALIQELRDKEQIYVEEESKAEQFLIILENKGVSITDQEKEALQRLYLVENFAEESYKDSKRLAQLGTYGLAGFVDVGMAVVSTCGGVGEALKKVPFVGEFLASPYIAAKNEMVNQIAVKSHIFLYQNYDVTWTLKGDILLREAIGKGYDRIFITASDALTRMNFSDAMAEVHKFIEKEFFIGIYETTTANFMNKSVEWAKEAPPVFRVGTFSSAENQVNKVLTTMNAVNDTKIKNAEMLIWAGDTIGTAGAIASGVVLAGGVVLSALSAKTIVGAPLAAILIPLSTKIAIATNTAAAGMKLGTTAGIAVDLWSTIPSYVKEGTAYSFGLPSSALEAPAIPLVVKQATPVFYDAEGKTDVSSGFHAPSIENLAPMQQGANDYNFILAEIREYIQNDKPEEIQKILNTLFQSGESLLGDVNVSASQILAASLQALRQVADYDAIFSKFETDLSKAAFGRIGLYTLLTSYLANPTDASIKELLTLQIVKTTDANDELSDTLVSTTQVLKNARITIPTLVIIKRFFTPDVIPLQKPFVVSAIVRNIGEKRASEVNVELSIPEDSGLLLMEEEIKSLGSLEPGAEQEVSFQLKFSPRGRSPEAGVNLVTISISSGLTTPDFATLPPTYIFIPTPPPTPPTGGKLSNKNVYAYPNPFNPQMGYVNIRYSLSKDANVTIKIYDVSGELVSTLIEEQPREKTIEYSESWDGRNDRGDGVANGVYFYLITTTAGEKAVGKIAVLR